LSIAFLFDDNPGVGLGDAALDFCVKFGVRSSLVSGFASLIVRSFYYAAGRKGHLGPRIEADVSDELREPWNAIDRIS
jgi:hypothetical protein